MDRLEVIVIGGGIIGMAVARRLALAGREVALLEGEPSLGAHTSSRNSEVIHAGIYYEPGSLKARLCVAGKHALYDYCNEHGVPHRRVGKLMVGTNLRQREVLEQLKAQAAANGVHDLTWVDRETLRELEPDVAAEVALWSPSTGILDSHEFLMSLKREAIAAGAVIACASPVQGGSITDRGVSLRVGGAEPATIECQYLVNAAGLFAPTLARSIAGMPPASIPPEYLAKGHYFTLAGSSPFRHLIYPVPEPGGLGVHVTLDLAGMVRFGPDVQWVDQVDYGFDATRADHFYSVIRSYYPALADDALQPGYTGIRPKIVPPGAPAADFMIQGPETHGLPIVSLYGIESPGLTASLPLADHATKLLLQTEI